MRLFSTRRDRSLFSFATCYGRKRRSSVPIPAHSSNVSPVSCRETAAVFALSTLDFVILDLRMPGNVGDEKSGSTMTTFIATMKRFFDLPYLGKLREFDYPSIFDRNSIELQFQSRNEKKQTFFLARKS